MHNIAFIDHTCQKPYSLGTLLSEPLGGTEATVVRVAEALDAAVVQHIRDARESRYLPKDFELNPKYVVALRDPRTIPRLRKSYPSAALSLAA